MFWHLKLTNKEKQRLIRRRKLLLIRLLELLTNFPIIYVFVWERVTRLFLQKSYCFDKKWHATLVSDNKRGWSYNKGELVSTTETQCGPSFDSSVKLSFLTSVSLLSVCFYVFSRRASHTRGNMFGQPTIMLNDCLLYKMMDISVGYFFNIISGSKAKLLFLVV